MKRSALLAGFCLISAAAFAQGTTTFKTQMSGSQEVPPTTSKGTGTATVTVEGDKATYDVTYSGLTGAATAAHIHCPAAAGANAPVAVPFANPANPIKGSATLTAQQKTEMMDGKCYVNVHTAENKGGEIRGQLTK